MNLDNVAHLLELLASSGMLLFLWKANRFLNMVWDALKTAPPHLHVGQRIVYPPPFEKPDIGTMENGQSAR